MSVRIVALMAVLASFAVAPSNASAFGHLFGHRASGCDACACDVAPSCGCEVAMPTCGCEIVDPCCAPAKPKCGLFAKLKARKAAASCCAPAPTCGCEMPAPSCGCEMAAPSCGCEIAPSCGCEVVDPCCAPAKPKCGLFAKLKARKAAASCCAPAPTCGCEMPVASCGCGM